PHVQAVVCHGGFNTVVEALWHGVPLVIAPARLDQPVVADLVARAGAGLRVDWRSTPKELLSALRRVLAEPSFPAAARAVGASFATAGGAEAAAAHIVGLVHRGGADD